jgi:hypothetical protein
VGKRVEGPVPSPPHELLHLLPHLRLRIEGGSGRAWASSTASASAALATGGERVGPGGVECVCVHAVGDRLFCFVNGATVREAKL